MTTPNSWTIEAARDALRKGEITAVDLTMSCLTAMDAGDALNAYVHKTPEIALEQARAADAQEDEAENLLRRRDDGEALVFCGEGQVERRLSWAELHQQVAQAAGLSVIHLAPEPLVAGAVHQALTGGPMPASEARLHHEDMRSAHTGLWSRSGPYLMDKADCLTRLRRFYAEATA